MARHAFDDYDSQRNDEREQALERRLERDASREPFSARRVPTADDRRESLALSFASAFTRQDGGSLIAVKRGLPENWQWFQSEVKGERPHHCFIVRGGVNGEPFKSGKNKGRPNPAKRTNAAELVITVADLEAFKANWQIETGKCSTCFGDGKTVASSGVNGRTFRDCKRCDATGKATR